MLATNPGMKYFRLFGAHLNTFTSPFMEIAPTGQALTQIAHSSLLHNFFSNGSSGVRPALVMRAPSLTRGPYWGVIKSPFKPSSPKPEHWAACLRETSPFNPAVSLLISTGRYAGMGTDLNPFFAKNLAKV